MSYKAKVLLNTLEKNSIYKNVKGDHQCVALVQMAGNAPQTSKWKMGIKVITAPTDAIPKGTVIATFDETTGKYPTSARHAAFYVSHNSTGIKVYDQWKWNGKTGGKSISRTIRVKNKPNRNVNDANYYYVVE